LELTNSQTTCHQINQSKHTIYILSLWVVSKVAAFLDTRFHRSMQINMHYLHANRLRSGITIIWQSITVLQLNTSARRSIIYHLSSRAVVQKSYSDMLSECKLKFYHPLNMDTCYNLSCKMTLDYNSSNHYISIYDWFYICWLLLTMNVWNEQNKCNEMRYIAKWKL